MALMTPNENVAVGFAEETITVSSTAIGPSSGTAKFGSDGACARYAFFTVETDAIRYWYSGTDPTATTGHKVSAGKSFEILGRENVANLKMIRVTTDATVQASYAR